jgi:hypothetical protein
MMKNILLFTLLCSSLTYGMNTNHALKIKEYSVCFDCNGTKIHISKESLSSAANKVTKTIVGSNEQALLSGKFWSYGIGTIHDCPHKTQRPIGTAQVTYCTIDIEDPHLYEKKKKDESSSEDDIYKPYPYTPQDEKKQLWEGIHPRVNSSVEIIMEPCINKTEEDFTYYAYRNKREKDTLYNKFKTISPQTFTGDKALQEAKKDLKHCYREILKTFANGYRHPNTKYGSIAIQALSIDVGFPRDKAAPIAIASVLDFIQKNPKAYDVIYLVVKKRSDFELYKKLLLKHKRI